MAVTSTRQSTATAPQVPVYLSSSMSSDSSATAVEPSKRRRETDDGVGDDAENIAKVAIITDEGATVARLRDTIAALVRRYACA